MARTAVITGASSGIGFELARLFARDGWDLVLVSRDPARLREAGERITAEAGRPVEVRACDLSDPGAVDELGRELAERACGVDALVNNAGFGLHGPFAEADPETVREMMATNMDAPVALTRHILPGMLERRRGMVLNTASLAGFVPGPLMAVYYATKAFVISFSEALHEETRGTGVTVTALCPGPVETRFQVRAGALPEMFKGPMLVSAESVARTGYRAMLEGRAVVVPGLINNAVLFLARFSPRSLVRRAVRKRQEKRE